MMLDRRQSASTRNVALSALLNLYKEVLAMELPWITEVFPSYCCSAVSHNWHLREDSTFSMMLSACS
jgi:hypothetical protein